MTNKCKHCQSYTTNPKFCSRSCSTSYHNSISPKRVRHDKDICDTCGSPTKYRRKYCGQCFNDVYLGNNDTIQDVIITNLHKSSAFVKIRNRSRKIAKELNWTTCCNCGYNKHIEIAHIKPISDFPLDTLVSVVNDESNLLPLCPNCHWELDHGLLTI